MARLFRQPRALPDQITPSQGGQFATMYRDALRTSFSLPAFLKCFPRLSQEAYIIWRLAHHTTLSSRSATPRRPAPHFSEEVIKIIKSSPFYRNEIKVNFHVHAESGERQSGPDVGKVERWGRGMLGRGRYDRHISIENWDFFTFF